jgi:hypothetical protein
VIQRAVDGKFVAASVIFELSNLDKSLRYDLPRALWVFPSHARVGRARVCVDTADVIRALQSE